MMYPYFFRRPSSRYYDSYYDDDDDFITRPRYDPNFYQKRHSPPREEIAQRPHSRVRIVPVFGDQEEKEEQEPQKALSPQPTMETLEQVQQKPVKDVPRSKVIQPQYQDEEPQQEEPTQIIRRTSTPKEDHLQAMEEQLEKNEEEEKQVTQSPMTEDQSIDEEKTISIPIDEETFDDHTSLKKVGDISDKVKELAQQVERLREHHQTAKEERKHWHELRKAEELLEQQLLALDSIMGGEEVRKLRKEQVLNVQQLLSDIDEFRNGASSL